MLKLGGLFLNGDIMSNAIIMVGIVKDGFIFHHLVGGSVAQAGEEVSVDITSQEFKRQWWKLEFEAGSFKSVGGVLDFKASEELPNAEAKAKVKAEVKAKTKAEVGAEAQAQ